MEIIIKLKQNQIDLIPIKELKIGTREWEREECEKCHDINQKDKLQLNESNGI